MWRLSSSLVVLLAGEVRELAMKILLNLYKVKKIDLFSYVRAAYSPKCIVDRWSDCQTVFTRR